MTEARIEPVPPDPATARIRIKDAERYLVDGSRHGLSEESRQLLYWQACLSSLDAVLLTAGARVASGEGGHRLRLVETDRILGGNHPELFEELDAQRARRNAVAYGGAPSSATETSALREAVTQLLELARQFVER